MGTQSHSRPRAQKFREIPRLLLAHALNAAAPVGEVAGAHAALPRPVSTDVYVLLVMAGCTNSIGSLILPMHDPYCDCPSDLLESDSARSI
jgi:hypothetical protein